MAIQKRKEEGTFIDFEKRRGGNSFTGKAKSDVDYRLEMRDRGEEKSVANHRENYRRLGIFPKATSEKT